MNDILHNNLYFHMKFDEFIKENYRFIFQIKMKNKKK